MLLCSKPVTKCALHLFRLLFCSVAGIYEGREDEVGEGTELWHAYHTSTATQHLVFDNRCKSVDIVFLTRTTGLAMGLLDS